MLVGAAARRGSCRWSRPGSLFLRTGSNFSTLGETAYIFGCREGYDPSWRRLWIFKLAAGQSSDFVRPGDGLAHPAAFEGIYGIAF